MPTDFEKLPSASEEEEDLLDLAAHATRTSRLACQIILTDEMKTLTRADPARRDELDGALTSGPVHSVTSVGWSSASSPFDRPDRQARRTLRMRRCGVANAFELRERQSAAMVKIER